MQMRQPGSPPLPLQPGQPHLRSLFRRVSSDSVLISPLRHPRANSSSSRLLIQSSSAWARCRLATRPSAAAGVSADIARECSGGALSVENGRLRRLREAADSYLGGPARRSRVSCSASADLGSTCNDRGLVWTIHVVR